MWVRSEYAGEFAVLSAWLCALSPWSVSYVSRSGLRLFRVHFVYVFLQFFPDADLGEGLDPYVLVQDGAQFPPGLAVDPAYRLWFGAALVAGMAALCWIVVGVYVDRDERLPVGPEAVTGALAAATALALAGAGYYLGSGVAASSPTAFGYAAWLASAVVFTFALALSVAYYVYDERLEAASPVDPVRVMGGLLLATALPLTVATYYVSVGFSGITVPVGVVFMYLFGGLLLVVDRA
jgi:hypothetical protein